MRLERDKKIPLTFGQMSFQCKTDDITDDSETNSYFVYVNVQSHKISKILGFIHKSCFYSHVIPYIYLSYSRFCINRTV